MKVRTPNRDRIAGARWLPCRTVEIEGLQNRGSMLLHHVSHCATIAVLFSRHARTGEPFTALIMRWPDLLRAVVREPNGYSPMATSRVARLVRYAAEVSSEDAEILDGVLLFVLGPRAFRRTFASTPKARPLRPWTAGSNGPRRWTFPSWSPSRGSPSVCETVCASPTLGFTWGRPWRIV